MEDHEKHIAITFYKFQLAATLIWWLVVRGLIGKHLYDITNGSVFTRPSWLPRRFLHQLQTPQNRKAVFLASLVALVVGSTAGESHSLLLRILVAGVVSLYHLVESSVTHRHGEYPLLYNVWAMCLPSQYASAASWGIAIHFVLSTGVAKLMIGGSQWMAASTMNFYLTAYYQTKMKLSRPFLPSWNRWACQRSWATSFISVSTIVLECGLVPLTLFFNPNLRWIGSTGMILMHIGIFHLMSKKVGIVFATTLPTYIIGFRCTAEMGTGPWWFAVGVAIMPTILGVAFCEGHMLPENWPSSPVSLFMWSGDQAKTLAEALMNQDTRVVLGTSDKSPQSIVGLPVLRHGAVAPVRTEGTSKIFQHKEADQAVHDCVLRVIGFTLLHHKLKHTVPKPGCDVDWDMAPFLSALQDFLQSQQRQFETQSGQPLVNAYLVQIDGNETVAKVLNESEVKVA